MRRMLLLTALFTFGLMLVPRGAGAMPDADRLDVRVEPRSGSDLQGTASFREVPDGVRVVLDVTGASAGKHGAHIHEKGDCSASDAKSAGEHFAPDGEPHGLPSAVPHHLGDLGNLEVGPNGVAHLDIVVPGANLRPEDPHSFVGRALIVHADEDDGSQPSGNAGARIGCAEIRR